MSSQYKLVYFEYLRALAEPVRFVFAYAGVAYEDERLSQDAWEQRKPNYPWKTLPVLEVNGNILAQSNAILRYLGKQFNLAGENAFEEAKCDEMVEAMMDLTNSAFAALTENNEVKKAELIAAMKNDTFPKYLIQWNKILANNGGFLVGRKFTYADFSIASYLEIFNNAFGDNFYEKFPALKSHHDSVVSADGIKEWVAQRPNTEW